MCKDYASQLVGSSVTRNYCGHLSTGVGRSIENNTYYDTYTEFYEKELGDHRIYERKLVFLTNHNISSAAMSGIKRFATASFVTFPLPPKDKQTATIRMETK